MNRDSLQCSIPDLDDGRGYARDKSICAVLAVLCIALIAACCWLAFSLHTERANSAALKQSLLDEKTHCAALQASGQTAINHAIEVMENIDEERAEAAAANGEEHRFGIGSIAGTYKVFLEDTWDYTLSQVGDSGNSEYD